MSSPSITRSIVIRNPQGLHARPAQMLAQLAANFEARIDLVSEARRVDAKSILHLMTLAATQGTVLLVEAEGGDAQQAVDAIAALVENGFVEKESCESGQAN
ncbi:MAG: HPr family phosphocarrier protein [Planctomycetes bacterium]|nr:HPr family phosphocarrier protein [Planctomycetota bacterium]